MLKFKANEAVLFRQDSIHQVSSFEHTNLRLFRYFDIVFLPRHDNSTISLKLENDAKVKQEQLIYNDPEERFVNVSKTKAKRTESTTALKGLPLY